MLRRLIVHFDRVVKQRTTYDSLGVFRLAHQRGDFADTFSSLAVFNLVNVVISIARKVRAHEVTFRRDEYDVPGAASVELLRELQLSSRVVNVFLLR